MNLTIIGFGGVSQYYMVFRLFNLSLNDVVDVAAVPEVRVGRGSLVRWLACLICLLAGVVVCL